jgi:hypothetical protein
MYNFFLKQIAADYIKKQMKPRLSKNKQTQLRLVGLGHQHTPKPQTQRRRRRKYFDLLEWGDIDTSRDST